MPERRYATHYAHMISRRFGLYPEDVGVPDKVVVTEARGLRAADASRPKDVVVLDFFAEGRHLMVDVVVTIVYGTTSSSTLC